MGLPRTEVTSTVHNGEDLDAVGPYPVEKAVAEDDSLAYLLDTKFWHDPSGKRHVAQRVAAPRDLIDYGVGPRHGPACQESVDLLKASIS